MNKPLISILIPAYNAERYLESALASILNQTYRELQIIVVNDGSTDATASLLDRIAATDARVEIIHQTNTGIVGALNRGLRQVRGEYIARMDADDLCVPHRIAAQVAFLQSHPDHVAVGSGVLLIDTEGDPIGPKRDVPTSHEDIDAALMIGSWPIVHPTLMMRTEAVNRIGGYREHATWEDHDLFLRLAEIGRLANLPEDLLQYRLHLSSIVHQRSDDRSHVLKDLLQEARMRRGLAEDPQWTPPPYKALSTLDHLRNWVWWALAGGNVGTARKYAWAAWKAAPTQVMSWRCLFCALRGR